MMHCGYCGATYRRAVLVPGGLRCVRCSGALVPGAEPLHIPGAIVGAAAGALLGFILGGPPGVVVLGFVGFLVGGKRTSWAGVHRP